MSLLSPPPRKVALIHYWLVKMRGGEKVLEALCRMYPQADIFTHVVDRENISPLLQSRNIHTTFIQRLPWAVRQYQKYLPLMPMALEQVDLSDYDLVISSESGPAKGVLTRTQCPHVCYCHSPMRYLWDFYPQYLAGASWPIRQIMRPVFTSLRQWDVICANRVDHFVANSATVARRVRKHWRREASVVHPPVDVHNLHLASDPREDFYLCAGQLVDYKRVDLAVEACTRLKRRLLVVGDGPALKKVQALAGPTVEFLGWKSNTELTKLYASCRALLFPGEEDFGMVPVEAMATGAPVLAYSRGGATESVLEGETGIFFHEQSVEALCATMVDFEARQRSFDPAHIRAHALHFDEERFATAMYKEIEQTRQKVLI